MDHKFKALGQLWQENSNPVSITSTFGGVARNVAENLAYWTQNIYLQCIVGNDMEGKNLLTHMQQLNVNIDHSMTTTMHPTSRYYSVLTETGELNIAYVNTDCYQHLTTETFIDKWQTWQTNSIAFIDTNFSTSLIETAIHVAKEKNIKLCIDPVSIQKLARLPDNLSGLYLLKPNQWQAGAATGIDIDSIDKAMIAGHALLKRGVENVVISLGKLGYVMVNKNEQYYGPAIPVKNVADVNGAGDAFMAGILFGLQQEKNLQAACELGAQAAAHTIQSLNTVVPSTLHI